MPRSFDELAGESGSGAASIGDLGIVAAHVKTLEAGYEVADTHAGSGSHQTVAADLELDAGAGTSDQGDTSFLGAIMGNLLGAALTKTHNFLGGLIGAYSITGAGASLLQKGAVIGVIMDGSEDADGCVVAVIDGGDPSETTRATAAFAARINNNSGDSGVDYGLDLYDAGRDDTLYSGGGDALAVANADLRLTNEVCIFSSATEPVDTTTGAGFAGKGSLCVARDTGVWYANENTKASPTWNLLGEQGS